LVVNLSILFAGAAGTMVALYFVGLAFWWILLVSPVIVVAWHLLVEHVLSGVVNCAIERIGTRNI
jgi:hypothetical protein